MEGEFWPEVMFSYATGKRPRDAEGTGPGLIHAARLALCFHREGNLPPPALCLYPYNTNATSILPSCEGIQVFSGLHVSASENWRVYFPKLSSRFSKCRVLIVLLTKALYTSLNCLEEIYTGLSEKKVTHIIPVVFEDGSSFPSKARPNLNS